MQKLEMLSACITAKILPETWGWVDERIQNNVRHFQHILWTLSYVL